MFLPLYAKYEITCSDSSSGALPICNPALVLHRSWQYCERTCSDTSYLNSAAIHAQKGTACRDSKSCCSE